ncbi:hypothetical protein BKA58DRAFT_465785 [Alternaria rosae]|uniref:uncharacterized protein n=1 Tax=Alternaria rosae TaxID=1187941 RepID=UPI001E8DA5C8|nr:uncharacterized protein BKA58DRAFT_465785 [Alternaria rosae]KAH6878062.1 hypothetical protein BKA58DRAFT_465785 [Alternaria rosae]
MEVPAKPKLPDAYADLELSPETTNAEIKASFRRLALLHHPDKNAPGQTVDAADFRRIQEAYDLLRNPEDKACYDQSYTRIHAQWADYKKEVEEYEKNPRAWREKKLAEKTHADIEAELRKAQQQGNKPRSQPQYEASDNDDDEFGYRREEQKWEDLLSERLRRTYDAKAKRSEEERSKVFAFEEPNKRCVERLKQKAKAQQAQGDGIRIVDPDTKRAMAKTWVESLLRDYCQELKKIGFGHSRGPVIMDLGWERKKGRQTCLFCEAKVQEYSYQCPSGGAVACRGCKKKIETSSLKHPFDFNRTDSTTKKGKDKSKDDSSKNGNDKNESSKKSEKTKTPTGAWPDSKESDSYTQEQDHASVNAELRAAEEVVRKEEAERQKQERKAEEARRRAEREAKATLAREAAEKAAQEKAAKEKAEAEQAARDRAAAQETARKVAEKKKKGREQEAKAKKAARKKAAKERAALEKSSQKNAVGEKTPVQELAQQVQDNAESGTEKDSETENNTEQRATERAELEAKESAAREAEAQAAGERAAREAEEHAAREAQNRAVREAQELEERESSERNAAMRATQDDTQGAVLKAKGKAELEVREMIEHVAKETIERVTRETVERVTKETVERVTREMAEQQAENFHKPGDTKGSEVKDELMREEEQQAPTTLPPVKRSVTKVTEVVPSPSGTATEIGLNIQATSKPSPPTYAPARVIVRLPMSPKQDAKQTGNDTSDAPHDPAVLSADASAPQKPLKRNKASRTKASRQEPGKDQGMNGVATSGPSKPVKKPKVKGPLTCYMCNEAGHKANSCPTKTRHSMFETVR